MTDSPGTPEPGKREPQAGVHSPTVFDPAKAFGARCLSLPRDHHDPRALLLGQRLSSA
jgi:hypothetical protein